MACTYKSNGRVNPVNTDIFQYVEDVSPNERLVEFVEQVLIDREVVYQTDEGLLLNPIAIEYIGHANKTAYGLFGASLDLLRIDEGNLVTVNENSLKSLRLQSNDPIQIVEGQNRRFDRKKSDTQYTSDFKKTFIVQENLSTAADQILLNLQKQIDRINRVAPNKRTKAQLYQLEKLKKNLKEVRTRKDEVIDYLDFVNHVVNTAVKARNIMDEIEVYHTRNYQTASKEELHRTLNKISELKLTIDAYYQDNPEKSLMHIVQQRLMELEDKDGIKDDLILNLVTAMEDMKQLNTEYLLTATTIQGDALVKYANFEVNNDIDEKIKNIRETRRLSGINRKDPEFRKARRESIAQNSIQPLLDLNIKQLENQKIGRDQIIRELRQTHLDATWFSMYTDPLIYSSEKSLQLFAMSMKEKFMESNDRVISTVLELEPEYKKFLAWKGVGEDNVEKLYEDISEVVTVYVKDGEDYVPVKVNSFVQQYNITKFYENQVKAINQAKKDYNFPKDRTLLADWYKSKDGRQYNKALASWRKANTVPIPGAQKILDDMRAELFKLEDALRDESLSEKELEELQYEFHALQYEYDSLQTNGIPKGILAKPNDSYLNPKFTNMPAEAKEYYDYLMDLYEKDQNILGGKGGGLYTNSWDSMSYILPSIRKSVTDQVIEGKYKNSAKNLITDAFSIQETDTEFGEMLDANGEKIKMIPRYYTNIVQADLVSMDVTNSMIKFHDMASRYKAKGELQGVVNIMRASIENRKVLEMHSSGNAIVDMVASKMGLPMVPKTKEGKDSNSFKQLESAIDAIFYGKANKGEIKNNLLFGLTNANKLASTASTITALAGLSLNFLQVTNQLVIDSTIGSQEAWAKQFYSREDLFWARRKVYNFGFGLADLAKEGLAPKFSKKSKIFQMIEKFDALQKFDRMFGSSAGSAIKKKLDINTAFFAQNGVELVTVAEKMLALSRSYKGKLKDANGKVLLNENGEEADLWDMLIEDSKGKLIVDSRVANFSELEFRAKLHGLLKRTNQLKGGEDTVLGERIPMGKMLLLFRKYFTPSYRKRFGHSAGGAHIDMELGAITEGYYQTFFNHLSNAFFALRTQGVGEALKSVTNFSKLSKEEKQNMRRLLHEQVVVAMSGIIAILIGNMSDDDEEDSWTEGMILYQALRLRTELSAFYSLPEFVRMTKSPMAATRPVLNLIELMNSIRKRVLYPIGIVPEDEVFYQRKSGMFEKGDEKWVKDFIDVLPAASGVFKTMDPGEAAKFFDLTN